MRSQQRIEGKEVSVSCWEDLFGSSLMSAATTHTYIKHTMTPRRGRNPRIKKQQVQKTTENKQEAAQQSEKHQNLFVCHNYNLNVALE